MISSISVQDLMNCQNINIIDVRSEQNYNNNHIPGAINIPYEKLIVNPGQYLNINAKYFIYCQKGFTSVKVCKILARLGYKVVNIIGGYEEWIMRR
jgi:rhodanese-related sulfurtransferase